MNKQPCRLCSTFPVVSYSLLNTESGNMLESLTSIKVSPNDNLSATACFVCIFDLKLAYNIQQKILKVDKKFRHNLPLGKNNCESFNENSKDRNLDLELELNIERNIKEAREFINNLKNRDVFHQSLSQNISNDFENKSDNSAFCGIPEVRVKEEPKEYKLGINEELIEAQMMDYQPISDPLSLNEDINIKQEQFNTDDNCLGCGQSFPFSDYKKHENCTSESDITCSICNSVFQDTALYNYHFKMHLITEQSTENIEGPSVRDRFLDNSSCSSSSFEDEDEFDEKQQEWKCNACSKVFKTQENYDCHTLEKQQCSICHQKVPSLCYEKHVADHTSKKQKCTLCGVTLQHLGSLKNNLTQIDQMQTCQDCSKDLEGKNKFVIDEKMHLGNIIYQLILVS